MLNIRRLRNLTSHENVVKSPLPGAWEIEMCSSESHFVVRVPYKNNQQLDLSPFDNLFSPVSIEKLENMDLAGFEQGHS